MGMQQLYVYSMCDSNKIMHHSALTYEGGSFRTHLTISRPSNLADVLLWMMARAAWIGVKTRNHIVITNCAQAGNTLTIRQTARSLDVLVCS